ncbi:MAG: hypothetical protein J6K53_04125 [Roseburia sp.]|nr:hypothetical protein [Roseburia sp.]
MGKIMTVTGEIDAGELGLTSMHEHLMCDTSPALGPVLKMYSAKMPKEALVLSMPNLADLRGGISAFSNDCCTIDALDYTVDELNYFKRMGGNAIVDASPLGMPHNLSGLKEASGRSGVKIVTCTGLYIQDAQPEEYRNMPEDELVTVFKKGIYEGIDESGVKAGFLKCAINTLDENGQIAPCELKAVRACAKAAAETGRSIHIHNAFPLTAEHILPVAKMVLDLDVKPEKLLMLHMGSFVRTPRTNQDYVKDFSSVKTVNIDMQLRLLDQGINIGFDSYGSLTPTLPDNNDMNKALVELLRRGYGSQIVLGHDITDKSRGVSYGYTGFTDFIRNVLPVLKENGLEAEAQKLVCDNPARILEY